MKIKFFMDSSCDAREQYVIDNDIHIFPMIVNFSDKSYQDWVELKSEQFYDLLTHSKELPTTSQPSIPDIEEHFRDALKTHDAVFCISLSSQGSGTYNACVSAKDNILADTPDAKIEIIDSMGYSHFLMRMMDEALRLYKAGKSIDEMVAGVKNAREHMTVCVVVDTLKYLEKGGRINKASLIMGTLLDLKPVLTVKKGVMESIDKFRGSKTVMAKMLAKLHQMDINAENPNFYIVHANVPERAQQLAEALEAEYGEKGKINMLSPIGATVGTHIGPGTLAVFFDTNKPQEPIYED